MSYYQIIFEDALKAQHIFGVVIIVKISFENKEYRQFDMSHDSKDEKVFFERAVSLRLFHVSKTV